jgi:heme exporter protein C
MAQGTVAVAAHPSTPKHAGSGAFETIAMLLLLGVAGYAALIIAPTERTMGLIQRIFYFHVPSWWCSFTAYGIAFYAQIAYLWKRKPKWDHLAVSAAEIGVAFSTVGLITGPIWAHPVWGIWWAWDERLTSAFVLWLLYVCYLLLRGLVDDPEKRAALSAVFGIFAAFDIPFVYFSIWFFRTQHPQPVIGDGGALAPSMLRVLLLCWAALTGVLIVLLRQRYRLEALRYEVAELRLEASRHEQQD